jgi:hypothetical protein
MRYLYTADDTLFAYAPGRRDFFRSADDGLFAHESHGWLLAAESGEPLAHLTGDVYYGAVDGERLYRVSAERVPAAADDASSGSSGSSGTHGSPARRKLHTAGAPIADQRAEGARA